MSRTIEKVLVANRGEIAVRIITGLRELGVASVAVYSDADASAAHVRCADEAVAIGAAPARESYLDITRVIEAARETGADAIHPGYGFLAENAEFSEAVEAAGITFIGPDAETIRAMGDKARARDIAIEAGVPVVPGHTGEVEGDALLAAAREVGYPLLIKPAAGGGGKGMRRVEDEADLLEMADAARREAVSSFGDDTLILERFVAPARHVEIQVFGDTHGGVVALGERECSLQRRHQKIIEECPSPATSDEVRGAMSEAACALSRAVGYRGAGTVEFLLGPDGDFYFLEMNTRLQVEHPVTEEVYGVDLVKAQVAVAEGRPLPETLTAARPRGHAIEARLYAEDTVAGFLPAPGPVHRLAVPVAPGVRFDGGVVAPGEVSAEYDPMIAKVVAWGTDRAEATARLRLALENTAVLGVRTNADFLLTVLGTSWFAEGDFDTGTVERRLDELVEALRPDDVPDDVLAVAAWALTRKTTTAASNGAGAGPRGGDPYSPFGTEGAWRGLAGGRS